MRHGVVQALTHYSAAMPKAGRSISARHLARPSPSGSSSAAVRALAIASMPARAKPGQLNLVSATGTNEFLFNGFLKDAGLSMARVPYRDTVQALNDLAEGRIDMFVGALAIMRPYVQAGKVKVLAVTNRDRAATMPDVPTVKEAGYPELGFDGLVGLFGPREMPNDLREKIAADIRVVMADPEIVTRLTATGQAISPGSAAEFDAEIKAQRAQIAAVGQLLGVKPAQ